MLYVRRCVGVQGSTCRPRACARGKHRVFCFTSRDELITLNAPTAPGSTRSRRLESVISGSMAPSHLGVVASPGRYELRWAQGSGGWKSRVMVDRYAKFATGHLAAAAPRIERGRAKTW